MDYEGEFKEELMHEDGDSVIKTMLDEYIMKARDAQIPGIINIIVDEYLESEVDEYLDLEFDVNKTDQIYIYAVQGLGYLLQNVPNLYLDSCLAGFCEGGHKELVEFIISRGATYWDWGLASACRGGHPELVRFMISKGARDWNRGLQAACRGGHKYLVIFMITKGASCWPWALRAALAGGHQEIAEWMNSLTNEMFYY